jgi:flagellin-like protein
MHIQRILRNKKAISPILATLLLVVIAVAAIVVTYAWITTYMGTTTQQAGFIPYEANVAFTGGNTVKIDVGNSGTSSGQVVAIYIGTSASSLTNITSVSPAPPQAIPNGQIVSFTVTYSYTAGNTYYFKVIPSNGAALSFSATA